MASLTFPLLLSRCSTPGSGEELKPGSGSGDCFGEDASAGYTGGIVLASNVLANGIIWGRLC